MLSWSLVKGENSNREELKNGRAIRFCVSLSTFKKSRKVTCEIVQNPEYHTPYTCSWPWRACYEYNLFRATRNLRHWPNYVAVSHLQISGLSLLGKPSFSPALPPQALQFFEAFLWQLALCVQRLMSGLFF